MGLSADRDYALEALRRNVEPTADLAAIPGGRKPETQSPFSAPMDRMVRATGSAAGRFIAGAQFRVRTAYADLAATTERLMIRAQDRARYFRTERPLQTLRTIAAAAFVCGIALRIWRSQKS